MKKYGGHLVFSTKDQYGPIEIVEYHRRSRSLHFGNRTQQSGMFLFNPVFLIHKYTQAMLTPLCWESPDKVLILGLGAGSIAKFLLHYFKETVVDAVELRPAVVDLAEKYFSLPPENQRFRIFKQAATDFLENTRETESYDLIILDLFVTVKEQDINVNVSSHFTYIKDILSHNGCLCINLLGNDFRQFTPLNDLLELFENNIYFVPVDSSNVILFALKQPLPVVDEETVFHGLEKRLQLPFRQYYNKIERI